MAKIIHPIAGTIALLTILSFWIATALSELFAGQATVTTDNDATTLAARGRHDPCVLPRAVPLVEAAVLLVLADHWLRQRAIAD